jgi:hypothetical protein
MKTTMKFWVGAAIALVIQSQAVAQKIDDERMVRDIEVAENVLSTLIKQEINQNRGFYGMDIKGHYQEGYGVTFRLPGDHAMAFSLNTDNNTIIFHDDMAPAISINRNRDDRMTYERKPKETAPAEEGYDLKEKAKEKKRLAVDSARAEYNKKLIKASKDFIIDYGDFISQLGANERIVVTNRGENRSWYFKDNKRTHISVEGSKADITAFKQGKLTREQALAKLKVVNTEYVEEKEPDMELFSTIFNRLYRQDLSKTFFSESNIYYERLKEYGAIYYMTVSSSYRDDFNRHRMPTQGLEGIDEETRNKKVTELYPKFEQDLKDNILEYGRTLKTLGDEEVLVFNTNMTKCPGCGIPSTLEVTIKASVLKDFGAGKIDRNTAMGKFAVKKGVNQ